RGRQTKCAWGPPPVPDSKASEARQLYGQAKRGSCKGKWKLAQNGQAKRGSCMGKRSAAVVRASGNLPKMGKRSAAVVVVVGASGSLPKSSKGQVETCPKWAAQKRQSVRGGV
ncbi:MAG TPA: hypothetical protein DCE42_03195, partial [Myxococcales bacterium]|nr:hypothetical protein [Myxococcales bacterium]